MTTIPNRAPEWRKSSRSGNTSCVEVRRTLTAVRDSKNPTGPLLLVSLAGLLAAVKSDQFER